MNKGIKLLILFLIVLGEAIAQEKGEWYKGEAADGKFGMDLHRTQEFLKNKKTKKQPIVAILTTGIDHEHEYLEKSIWVNPKEKDDGKDNDKNGYVDDINGWNFIGSADGENFMEFTSIEGDREWLRLKDKYANLFYDGKDYFTLTDGQRVKVPAPLDMDEYNYFYNLLLTRSTPLGSTYASTNFSYIIADYVNKWDNYLNEVNPGVTRDKMFSDDYMIQLKDNVIARNDSLEKISFSFVSIYANFLKPYFKSDSVKSTPWSYPYNNFAKDQIEKNNKGYEDILRKSLDKRAEIIGDKDYLDFDDRFYGNNVLLTTNSMLGTVQAGIIKSISPEAKVLPLIISAVQGDPYIKDIVNAVKYAVSKGADVIVLPAQNALCPIEQRIKYAEALKEAESNGAVLITSVVENYTDLNTTEYYPSSDMDSRFMLNSLITVANSDSLGNPTDNSSFGDGKLDIYAPGQLIYSSTPGDLYRSVNSTVLGANMVAGVAALIKTYFPKMGGEQIREIIMNNVTLREGYELEKKIVINDKTTTDLFLFEQLCTSGGILNSYNAIQAAFSNK